MHHCQHKWWSMNLRHNYRSCKYCFRTEYNYTGEWKGEIRIEAFIASWTPLGGHEPTNAMTLECCQMFERWTNEMWNPGFVVVIDGNRHGPYRNFNHADWQLRKFYEHKDGRIVRKVNENQAG